MPFQVLSLQFGMWGLLGLFGDGSDGGWAIDRFFGAGHVGQPGNKVRQSKCCSVCCQCVVHKGMLTVSGPT